MANNSINGRFRKLYSKVENNLTDESRTLLIQQYKLGANSLHSFRKNLLDKMHLEFIKILDKTASENNLTPQQLEFECDGNEWDQFRLVLDILDESIEKFPYDFERQDSIDYFNSSLSIDCIFVRNLKKAIWKIEKDLKITGQVIDFMLSIYDISQEITIVFE